MVNTVWSYDPVTRLWSVESPMSTPRKNFGLVATNGKLYAIGGEDRQGRYVLCDMYSIISSRVSYLAIV